MPLTGRRIAVPESRQLDLLAQLLKKRGAEVLRCPLVAIYDSPETEVITAWIKGCIARPYDDLILLTGEGLRRLLGFAAKHGVQEQFINALVQMCIIARGPKPGQALKQIGLKPDLVAQAPTTEGVIATLEQMKLDGCRVAVQLYGDNPNSRLINYLTGRNANVTTVAPYRYAPDSDDQRVTELIGEILSISVDAITFTSQPQIKRLLDVAEKLEQRDELINALNRIVIVAVGPVVADAIERAGVQVDVMPEDSYFMKPMVNALSAMLATGSAKTNNE